MFSSEYNGYNRREVEEFIAKLKAEHEAMLMEEKLKVLESEKKLLDYKSKSYDLENRERSIMSALDMFRKYEDEGKRNLTELKATQLKMVYGQIEILFQELSIKYPGIEHNNSLRKISEDIEQILQQLDFSERAELTNPIKTENDSMRMLLNKMQGYRKASETPREVRIDRINEKNMIKPVTDMKLEDGESYANLVDKFLDTRPEEKTRSIQSSGFDLKEAINPKDDLAEIMKAFDFYGGNGEND